MSRLGTWLLSDAKMRGVTGEQLKPARELQWQAQ